MARPLTFATKFPAYHPKKGDPTHFVEKIWKSIGLPDQVSNKLYNYLSNYNFIGYSGIEIYEKKHTIRAGNRWKPGDWFKPVIWGNDINPKSGRSAPYHSKLTTANRYSLRRKSR